MTQRSLFWPLSMLAIFAGVLLLLLGETSPHPISAQNEACLDPGQDNVNCPTTQEEQAGVANNPYPSPEPSPQPNIATLTFTPTPSPSPSPSSSPTPSATPTNGGGRAANTPTMSPTATATPQNGNADAPTLTPTIPYADFDQLICQPGATVALTGTTEPNTALLAFFADRAVGGSFSHSDGQYTITLRIGSERPGIYPVEVQMRSSRTLVDRWVCEVPGMPAVTPTATVVRGP